MQRYLRMIVTASILLTVCIMDAVVEKKTKKEALTTIKQRYRKKDAKIHKKYARTQSQYYAKKYKSNIAARCSKDSLSLTQLQERADNCAEHTTSFSPSMIPEDDVLYFLEETVNIAKEDLLNKDLWVDGKSPYTGYFFNTANHANFKPFMQKMIVPPGSTIFVWGDTHGCIHSLLRTLNRLRDQGYLNDNFKLTKPNTYLMYLGDCVDRGCYGLEVLYTLMRLKTANPDNVILIRGNHEDAYINRTNSEIRFNDELTEKEFHHRNRLFRLYDMMPPIVYLGSGNNKNRTYLMCCHGGLEIGITPLSLINAPDHVTFMALSTLQRADMVDALPADMQESLLCIMPPHLRRNVQIKSPTTHYFGYMWSNFLIGDPQELVRHDPHGWVYGKALTRFILDRDGGPEHRIKSILRAHQHVGLMQQELAAHKGFFSMWDNMVLTLISAPSIELIPPCPYDSMIKMVTAEKWDDWKFTHLSHPIPS